MTFFQPITEAIRRGFVGLAAVLVVLFLLAPLYRRLAESLLFGDPLSRKGPR